MDPASSSGAPKWSRVSRVSSFAKSSIGSRLGDPDVRVAAGLTCLVALLVLAIGRVPLSHGIQLDLREGDRIGGASQLWVVGFSMSREFGRVAPEPVAQADVRIVANRPLPERFELTLEAWWMKGATGDMLGVGLGDQRHAVPLPDEAENVTLHFSNPDALRVIDLRIPDGDRLALRRVDLRIPGPQP